MKIWRRNARLKLIAFLGGKCAGEGCNVTDPEELEFEHKTPLTKEQQEYRESCGANRRMVLNRKEAAEGLLQLMCHSCNIKKSYQQTRGKEAEPPAPVDTNNEPF